MKYILKLQFLLALTFLLGGIVFTRDVKASDVWLDSEYNFCFSTSDQKHTSSIIYRTFGFTLVECGTASNPSAKVDTVNQSGPIVYDSKITDNIYNSGTTTAGFESQNNVFKISMVDAVAGLGASVVESRSVAERVQRALSGEGPGLWIRFDAIMYVIDAGKMSPYQYNNIGYPYTKNPAEIMSARGWANPSGLKTHFKQYWYIGKNSEVEKTNIERLSV